MPRGARLDAPGTLHHVMVRGIEGRNIVEDDRDRERFVSRTGEMALDTGTSIYAWALMGNHAHFLLKSGAKGLSAFMRRLLSGYAVYFNRRHKRYGHLFQNRYKSIVCEEDVYFRELVRYIHLNPLRASIVDRLAALDKYKWCGHSVLMNHQTTNWQDRDYVLKWFGDREGEARKSYRRFVQKGIALGKQPNLTGGGLIRSMGGWSEVKSRRKSELKEKGDERVLGSTEFVFSLLDEAEGRIKSQIVTPDMTGKIREEIAAACRQEEISVNLLQSGSRQRPLPGLRKMLALKFVREYGVSLAETARHLGMSTSGVAQILRRNGK